MYRDVGTEARLPKKKWSLSKALVIGLIWSAILLALNFEMISKRFQTWPIELALARNGAFLLGPPLFCLIVALIRNAFIRKTPSKTQ